MRQAMRLAVVEHFSGGADLSAGAAALVEAARPGRAAWALALRFLQAAGRSAKGDGAESGALLGDDFCLRRLLPLAATKGYFTKRAKK